MKRAKFSLSHYKLLTCDMGELVPIACMEVLPGDTFQHATSVLLRVSPLLAPVMHPVHVRIHHWYVPTRMIWDEFEDFITGGPTGNSTPVPPTITVAGGFGAGGLGDYFGLPLSVPNTTVSVLPYRAYSMIWNEWYRDQDLQTELTISKASGNDTTTNLSLQNVCWEKDYFTTSRPWTQKGPAITLPLGTTAPIVSTNGITKVKSAGGGGEENLTWSNAQSVSTNPNLSNDGNLLFGSQVGLRVDLTGAQSVGVNALRTAFALQRYEEARARYGSRYTEYLRYLGVRSSDARLQRPEYLGGGKQTIQFSEVLQTGPNASDAGVANLKGHGIGALRSNRYRRFFEEHGYVITLISVKPKTIYLQGIPKMWRRSTKEDYFQRELQHIGQQEVYNREIYAGHNTPGGVFGYQDRYDEYRRCESSISGEFRSSLNYWHFGRIFASDPALNADFVKATVPKRPLASQSTDALYLMANHSIQARRLLSAKGNSFIY